MRFAPIIRVSTEKQEEKKGSLQNISTIPFQVVGTISDQDVINQ